MSLPAATGESRILQTAKELYRTEGLRGFSRGLAATWICQGLNMGLNFGIYETLNTNRLKKGETRTSFLDTLYCGAVAGCNVFHQDRLTDVFCTTLNPN